MTRFLRALALPGPRRPDRWSVWEEGITLGVEQSKAKPEGDATSHEAG